MNNAKVQPESYVQFLLASPLRYTCTEAARVQPEQASPPAHDSFNRLLTRLEPDPETLWLEARAQIQRGEGVLILDDSTLDKPYARTMDLVGQAPPPRQGHQPVEPGVDRRRPPCPV